MTGTPSSSNTASRSRCSKATTRLTAKARSEACARWRGHGRQLVGVKVSTSGLRPARARRRPRRRPPAPRRRRAAAAAGERRQGQGGRTGRAILPRVPPDGFLERLDALVAIDSPTGDLPGVDACARLLARWAERAGANGRARRVARRTAPDRLDRRARRRTHAAARAPRHGLPARHGAGAADDGRRRHGPRAGRRRHEGRRPRGPARAGAPGRGPRRSPRARRAPLRAGRGGPSAAP